MAAVAVSHFIDGVFTTTKPQLFLSGYPILRMAEPDIQRISDNILKGLPGSEEGYSMEDFKTMLNTYKGIDADQLRSNLVKFLEEIILSQTVYGRRNTHHRMMQSS